MIRNHKIIKTNKKPSSTLSKSQQKKDRKKQSQGIDPKRLADIESIKAGHVSKVSQSFNFERLSWSTIKRSISLIEELTVEDAEASDAISNVQRLGNSGMRWLVVSPNAKVGKQAYDELEVWSSSLFRHRVNGGIYALVNYFLRQVVITGAGSAENKVSPNKDRIVDIYPVDVRTLEFVYNDQDDGYTVKQRFEGEEITLPPLTYQYIPMSTPLSGSPYPLPPLYSALEETENLRILMDSVKDGITKQRLLGLLTLSIKRMAKSPGQTDELWRKEQRIILNSVAQEFSKSLEDGILVHFDEMEPKFLSFASEMAKAIGIVTPFEQRTAKSLNFAWIREHGTIASAYMSIILEKILAEIQAIQLIVAQIVNKAALQHLYMRGIPVMSVKTTLDQDAIRIWDKILKQVQVFKELLAMDVVDKYQIGRELGYTPPDATTQEDNGTSDDGLSPTFHGYLLNESDCKRYHIYSLMYNSPIHIQLLKSDKENTMHRIGETFFTE